MSSDGPAELLRLVIGFQASQAIHVAVRLGIADHLKHGPRDVEDLARASEANPSALYRLLRALAALGVFHEEDQKKFSLTPMGEYLRSDSAMPVGPIADYFGRAHFWLTWGNLLHSVKTGQSAFTHVHGMTDWQYLEEHPDVGAVFDRAMSGNSHSDAAAAVAAYDFSSFKHVVDVAGGEGVLLAAILASNQATRGTLFDRPRVIARVNGFGEVDVSERVDLVCGDFFESVPEGGDAYLLKLILHDWDDEKSVILLRKIRKAITATGKLLVLERVLEPANQGAVAKLSDLNMMVSPGGIERTEGEFAAILEAAGFQLLRIVGTGSRLSVIEAAPI